MKRTDYNKLYSLHEKYGLKTDYLDYTKNLIKKKPKWKERRTLNRKSFWESELKSFLTKHQAIKYTPTKGTILDPTGVRFQF